MPLWCYIVRNVYFVNIVLHKIDVEAHLGLQADVSVILHKPTLPLAGCSK